MTNKEVVCYQYANVNKQLVNGEKCVLQFNVVLRFRSKLYLGASCVCYLFLEIKQTIINNFM